MRILIGLLGIGFGVLNLVRPTGWLRVSTRRSAIGVVAASVLVVAASVLVVAVSVLVVAIGVLAIPRQGGPLPPMISDSLEA